MNKKSFARWFGSAVLTGALVCSMAPALAGSIPSNPPAPSATPSAPADVSASPESIPEVSEPLPAATDQEAQPPATDTQPSGSPEVSVAPEASAGDVADTAEEEAGLLGAHMGQGLERLLATGDPQVPTSEEVEQKLEAETGLEAPLEVIDNVGGDPAASAFAGLPASAAFDAIAAASWQPAGIQGMDVSSHQQNVDWAYAWQQGSRFAYVKATEGTYYKNPYYSQQYNGSANTGMVRGAYHFAIPAVGSGTAEANYFVDNGGGWSADGRTLPPLLDIEYNPYPQLGNTCYNLSANQMVTWIRDFSNTIQARTGRLPMIYSTTDWWRTCTGNTSAFSNHPLHIASYPTAPYSQTGPGTLPKGWSSYAVWQYSSAGPFAGDSNVFNGDASALDAFARGANLPGATAISAKARANPGLGAARSGVVCGMKDNGCYQDFQNGAILWSPSTGAQISSAGDIRTAYQTSGFENGSLGYPTSGKVCGIKDGGCYQNYQGGAILWSPSTGAQLSPNTPIRTAYQASGFENGTLGYPTSGQICGIKDGGCYQNYQGGAILWSPSTGAQLSPNTPIRTAYQKHGFENGGLGYPTSGQICGIKDGGCYQNYQGGAITWSKSAGAHPTAGEIRKKWQSAGFETGFLGYPTADETCSAGKCTQLYEGGRINWTQAGGAVAVRK